MFFKPEIVVINHSDHTLEIEVIEIMRSNVGSLIVSYRDITFSYSRSYVQSTTQPISAGRHIFSPGCHTICPAKRNCTYQVNIFKVNATRIRKKILLKNEVWTITNESLGNLEVMGRHEVPEQNLLHTEDVVRSVLVQLGNLCSFVGRFILNNHSWLPNVILTPSMNISVSTHKTFTISTDRRS